MCNVELFFKMCVSVYLWVCEREKERRVSVCVSVWRCQARAPVSGVKVRVQSQLLSFTFPLV